MGAGASEFVVERARSVRVPREAVYNRIVDFHRWREWSPWEDLDPSLTRTFSGAPSGPGAVYEWSGNRKVGQGRMEITGAQAPSRVEIALQFIKPFKASNTTTFEITESDGGTRVTWRMVGKKTFLTRVMGIFKSMDAMVGPDFEKGLERLARAAEA